MNRFDGITPQGWEPDSQTIVSLILPDNLSKLVTQAEAMLKSQHRYQGPMALECVMMHLCDVLFRRAARNANRIAWAQITLNVRRGVER